MGLSDELVITSPVHEAYICGICKDVLLNPVMAEGCEHVFCKSCIENWAGRPEGKARCPIDRQEITGLKAISRPFKDLYENLQIRCKFHTYGCESTMNLGDIEDHVKVCELNPEFKKICLNGCGEMLRIRELHNHNCISFLKTTIEDQNKRIHFITTKLLATELYLLKTKIENLLKDHSTMAKQQVLKEKVKDLRDEIVQAKDMVKQIQVTPCESDYLKKLITEIERLEQALEKINEWAVGNGVPIIHIGRLAYKLLRSLSGA